ncbi:BREX-3 system P-loop-containing protein BrxF [Candidatus Stoquefichus sp. SB1]|jgi:chromosomal replication initiation ATPase DnaA|uniref:BREX-3 system P-loop-containing protein BrxF n=1 Tax=Candidatus Stoquefichus sp. SB1 TaxID=1658109 RepID=UPI00067F0A0F|nr:BREX-3 system P-loop-containing protein BrxF [Candidatus Stoquefichus sp. SB1]
MNISQRIEELSDAKHKLLLIIGQPGSGKSKMIRHYSEETGIPIVDLDKIFINTPSEQLMHEMKNFLSTYHQKVLLLDNKKILYAKNSQIDLLAFLKELSEDIIVVATWNGKIEDGQLFHFCKDAPEDLIYSVEKEDFKYTLC